MKRWKEPLPVKLAYGMLYVFLAAIAVTMLFPLINIAASSLSSSRAIVSGEVLLWPVEFNVRSYVQIFREGSMFAAFQNSVILTLVGTVLNIVATSLAAYPLSKKRLLFRSQVLMAIVFTMLFSAGLIPSFLLVKYLGLMGDYWALWLPGMISTYNLLVMKTYFESLPQELEESAAIDGASDPVILLRIILPLAKPMLAAISLFYAVGWWNSYFGVLLYINDPAKATLMVKLYSMLLNLNELLQDSTGMKVLDVEILTPEAVKAAAIVVSTMPILLVYPFLQKHFVKGVLIGSIKG
ncbi:carbohydrate ABC transporter permease [Paenibacillus sp. J5C_2022]|uniref:carbohydrate ABC transporter permease n=1 Tax=Paenibacillus sp. J5C2022 TaxID=2977129 RepID=UPI0021CED925|nr:carbohydrate ABC transporter permease [Paenibacillus sp. J5C2022]MCU6711852.1 carbohydrate ABC transporter permease [Paenibacillus sp. J5C2022]